MEKITSNIDKVALTKALILWCVGVYNEDNGICNIIAKIPWVPEWNKYMSWIDEVYPIIKNAIGERDNNLPKDFLEDELTRLVNPSTLDTTRINIALNHLTYWAGKRADKIIEAYNRVVIELNRKIEEAECVYGIIEKANGLYSNGFVKYDKVLLIKGKSKTEVINRLWSIASGLVYPNGWDRSVFDGNLICGYNICIGDGYYCHLGDKVTNSEIQH